MGNAHKSGSQINEHNTVRENVGLFDVSHMAVFDFVGDNQKIFLKYLIPNDVKKILDHKSVILRYSITTATLDDLSLSQR